ncbi:MAG: hypothetical protein GF408_02920 [Candidatus Omnitrophica bacterium]|nr:hypothetical protein [Candidatus Omnitrophota bacterium]
MNKPRIAIIRTDRIGEVLLSSIAVEAAAREMPGAEIYFVTGPYSAPMLQGLEGLEGIFEVETMSGGSILRTALSLAVFLRKKKINRAVVMNPHKALHLGCFLGGVAERTGYARKWGFFLNRKIRDLRDEGRKHEIEYAVDLLGKAGIDARGMAPKLPFHEGAARGLIARGDGPLIGFHPGSSDPDKLWPQSKYASLAIRLCEELGSRAVFLGGPGEKTFPDEGLSLTQECRMTDLAGKTSLRQLTAVLREVDVFVGNDSGPMHMAAAAGCAVVAVFRDRENGGSPVRWRPWGEGHIIFHETEAPLSMPDCDYRPRKEVTVDDVFNAVKEKLG